MPFTCSLAELSVSYNFNSKNTQWWNIDFLSDFCSACSWMPGKDSTLRRSVLDPTLCSLVKSRTASPYSHLLLSLSFSWCLYHVLCWVAQLCPTLCDLRDCSSAGSSAPGLFQARILEWIAISSSRESSQPGKIQPVSPVSPCIGRSILYHRASWEFVLLECLKEDNSFS